MGQRDPRREEDPDEGQHHVADHPLLLLGEPRMTAGGEPVREPCGDRHDDDDADELQHPSRYPARFAHRPMLQQPEGEHRGNAHEHGAEHDDVGGGLVRQRQ